MKIIVIRMIALKDLLVDELRKNSKETENLKCEKQRGN